MCTRLERNAFELTSFVGLKTSDIPENELTLREIVQKLSVGSGQGFKKCSCKKAFEKKNKKFPILKN